MLFINKTKSSKHMDRPDLRVRYLKKELLLLKLLMPISKITLRFC